MAQGPSRHLVETEYPNPGPRRYMASCADCGWQGRRLWPGEKKPCPQCGSTDILRARNLTAQRMGGGRHVTDNYGGWVTWREEIPSMTNAERPSAERMEKLPTWAAAYVATLETRITALEAANAELRATLDPDATDSNVSVLVGQEDEKPLGRDVEVWFRPAEDDSFSVQLDGGALVVDGSSALTIEPEDTFKIRLHLKKD